MPDYETMSREMYTAILSVLFTLEQARKTARERYDADPPKRNAFSGLNLPADDPPPETYQALRAKVDKLEARIWALEVAALRQQNSGQAI